ncbi:MAG: universal stress protein UspA [Klenkia sp.]|nr:universal stress protein UspA [Klenkia sp.]
MNPSATPRTIVVGVDGSTGSDEAAHAAAVAADAAGARLVVLRAFDWPVAGIAGLPDDVDGRAAAHDSSHVRLTWLVAQLARWLPAERIEARLVDGEPVASLRAAAVDAALLVVGAHGQAWHSGATLGSVTAALVRHSPGPVLVHRSRETLSGMPTGVLAGVDGGAGSAQVLAVAAREAALRRTSLHVLHTWPQLTEDAGTPVQWLLDAGATTTTEQAVVLGLVDALRLDTPGLEVEATVVVGRAGPALVHASHAAQLLVVGRPEVPAGQEVRATTRQVAHRAGCPVLVVPLSTGTDAHAAGVPEPVQA